MTAGNRRCVRDLLKRHKVVAITLSRPGVPDRLRLIDRRGAVKYAVITVDGRAGVYVDGCTSRLTPRAALLAISRYDAMNFPGVRNYFIKGLF